MNWNLFIIFCLLNVANVIIQTVKSLATIKCGKTVAALVNAVAYGLYTVVVVYTVCDLALWLKVLVVAVANLIGVFVVKWLEEKSRKDKMWKIEIAVPHQFTKIMHQDLRFSQIEHNFTEVGSWTMFNCYCMTQLQTKHAIEYAKAYKGKYSAYESKISI